VSELTGVPVAAGAANIYRVSYPGAVFSQFKTITDMAFSQDGNLYVVEHASAPCSSAGREGCCA
jgi:hypothetical protein